MCIMHNPVVNALGEISGPRVVVDDLRFGSELGYIGELVLLLASG